MSTCVHSTQLDHAFLCYSRPLPSLFLLPCSALLTKAITPDDRLQYQTCINMESAQWGGGDRAKQFISQSGLSCWTHKARWEFGGENNSSCGRRGSIWTASLEDEWDEGGRKVETGTLNRGKCHLRWLLEGWIISDMSFTCASFDSCNIWWNTRQFGIVYYLLSIFPKVISGFSA
jgi:hypothetical protein